MYHGINQQANKEEYNKNVNDMKTRLLSGLTALLLGGLTSCSNILEENGVINNVAESGMGELRINLSTDASLNVSTKAEAGKENVQNITKYQGTITVTTTKGNDVIGNPELPSREGTYTLPLGTYTLSATNDKTMKTNFEWDCPVLATTSQNVKLTKEESTKDVSLDLTLQNSIIAVNDNDWDDLKGNITVTGFQVINTEDDIKDKNTPISDGTSLLDDNDKTALHTGLLYAKAELENVKVVLDGYVGDNTEENTFRAVTEIKPTGESAGTQLGSQNKYNIGFNLHKENGSLKISVKVNNEVNSETITLDINPYDSTTQETPSTDGGGE